MLKLRNFLACTVVLSSIWPAVGGATDVGVSVQVSQPGVYGRVDIGRFPQPQVVVQQPVIIAQPRVVVRPEPVYMWVPPGHRKNWRKHCARYRACGTPVYFVQDGWYHEHVARGDRRHDAGRYGRERSGEHGHDNGKGKGKHRD
jgi:hypothetical protein